MINRMSIERLATNIMKRAIMAEALNAGQALAEVRDQHPTAWGSLQESVLDLSREMGF